MVTKSEIIDIIEIIYFVPALPLAVWVCVKHGFSREAGWLLLVILSLVRIVGAALGIAAIKEPSNTGIFIGSLALAGIGSATLVAAYTGIVNRIDTGSKQSPFPPRVRKLLQLMGIAAIILASTGASYSNRTLTKVAIVLILIQFLASAFILGCSAIHIRAVMQWDRLLLYIAAAATPFILVRIIYSFCSAFSSQTSRTFSLASNTTTAVALRGVLGLAMEIVAVTLLIAGGLMAPKMQKDEPKGQPVLIEQQDK